MGFTMAAAGRRAQARRLPDRPAAAPGGRGPGDRRRRQPRLWFAFSGLVVIALGATLVFKTAWRATGG